VIAEIALYDYGDKCMVFETRGLSVDNSADEEINKLFGSTRGNKIGVIFYGSNGYLVQREYNHCIAYDKDFNVTKEFRGGGDHFGNFIEACISRRAEDLNADAWEGHLSAALAHLANISYYLGEKNHVSPAEAKRILSGIKSTDDNLKTLERSLRHLTDNGVDLAKYPISMGPFVATSERAKRPRAVLSDGPSILGVGFAHNAWFRAAVGGRIVRQQFSFWRAAFTPLQLPHRQAAWKRSKTVRSRVVEAT
jgi:hypothetical protein